MLDVGPGVVSIKGEWSEVESELPYNKARSAVLHKESLGLFQLGSVTLGRVNEEEAEKGEEMSGIWMLQVSAAARMSASINA
jgi:hypothetical protein